MKLTPLFIIALVGSQTLLIGCGAGRAAPGGCTVGVDKPCQCPSGASSVQHCTSAGLGTCECAAVTDGADMSMPQGPAVCGDDHCTGDETCRDCAQDCGECPMCQAAPSCTSAAGVPAHPVRRYDLDIGRASCPPACSGCTCEDVADGGISSEPDPDPMDCKDPELRVRVSDLYVRYGTGTIYCIVQADDGTSSEVALLPKTGNMNEQDTYYYAPDAGLVWGQKGLKRTVNNLTINYTCWRVKNDAASNVLKAIQDAAVAAGGVAGPWGWAFGLGAVAAGAAKAGADAANASDEALLKGQQTIDRKTLLDLTNGRNWKVRWTGGSCTHAAWDKFPCVEWTLGLEAWGCADAKPPTPQ